MKIKLIVLILVLGTLLVSCENYRESDWYQEKCNKDAFEGLSDYKYCVKACECSTSSTATCIKGCRPCSGVEETINSLEEFFE